MASRFDFKQGKVADLRKRELLATLGVGKISEARHRLPSIAHSTMKPGRDFLSVEPRKRQPFNDMEKNVRINRIKLAPVESYM